MPLLFYYFLPVVVLLFVWAMYKIIAQVNNNLDKSILDNDKINTKDADVDQNKIAKCESEILMLKLQLTSLQLDIKTIQAKQGALVVDPFGAQQFVGNITPRAVFIGSSVRASGISEFGRFFS